VTARRGIFVAPFEELSEPALVAELAVRGEERHWEELFVWEHIACVTRAGGAQSAGAVLTPTQVFGLGLDARTGSGATGGRAGAGEVIRR